MFEENESIGWVLKIGLFRAQKSHFIWASIGKLPYFLFKLFFSTLKFVDPKELYDPKLVVHVILKCT